MTVSSRGELAEISTSARGVLERHLSGERLRATVASPERQKALWAIISELGWCGVAVDERFGGAGLGLDALVVLHEELGRHVTPLPFHPTIAAALLIDRAGNERQRERWLPGLADGSLRGAVAVLHNGHTATAVASTELDVAIFVSPDGTTGRLDPNPQGTELVALDPTRPLTRLSPSDHSEELNGDVRGAMDAVLVSLASETLGVARQALEMAVAYARERHQFGRPIGSFQAVQHLCADMRIGVDRLDGVISDAVSSAAGGGAPNPLSAAAAGGCAGETGWTVVNDSLQVHGGIGFTWEHDLHLLLKRVAVNSRLYWTAPALLTRVGRLRVATA